MVTLFIRCRSAALPILPEVVYTAPHIDENTLKLYLIRHWQRINRTNFIQIGYSLSPDKDTSEVMTEVKIDRYKKLHEINKDHVP